MATPVVESFESYSTANFGDDGTSISVTKPTGVAAGDLLVAIVAIARYNATFDPGDWTLELAPTSATYAIDQSFGLLWKVAGASEPSSYTFELATNGLFGSYRWSAVVARISGTDGDVSDSAHSGGTTYPAVAPSVTSPADGLMVSAAFPRFADDVLATPDGMTELWSKNYDIGAVNHTNQFSAYEGTASGATGTRSFTTGASDNKWVAFSIAIAPAGAGGGTDDLTADDVEAASEVTSPSIGQEHALTANDVEAASEVSAPVVGQVHALTADSVESASEITSPAIGQVHGLLAGDVEGASELTSPALGQVHALLAADVESASEVTGPDLGQVHVLTADDAESASEVSSPTLAEVSGDVLLAEDVEAASEVSVPSLGQVHVLGAVGVDLASEVTSPVLSRPGQQQQTTGGAWGYYDEDADEGKRKVESDRKRNEKARRDAVRRAFEDMGKAPKPEAQNPPTKKTLRRVAKAAFDLPDLSGLEATLADLERIAEQMWFDMQAELAMQDAVSAQQARRMRDEEDMLLLLMVA